MAGQMENGRQSQQDGRSIDWPTQYAESIALERSGGGIENTRPISGRLYLPITAYGISDYFIQIKRAERAKLRPIFTSRLPIRTLIAIYKCYIRSRLTYAALPWCVLCSEL
ncbi:hypothetical protein EVAR_83141_1 [Eumeta japonica]|uniref:Uncharacterized protein n=1 Tax=Eumeta variegata TaxID=151549 RepID=A0A4C1Y8P9_EUMVA|nr:hypothetical protein EVAR_83141_1 [Eumeta japonica]